jgi:Transposase DDE domain
LIPCWKLAATTLIERAIYLTVLHRLFAGGSDRVAERWRAGYLIPGTAALELHHLYRAMAFLGQEIEAKSQKTLGAPRCLKDWNAAATCLPKWTWFFSILLRSTLKAGAERPSVNVATVRITGPIFIRWSSAWPWTSRADRFAASCGRCQNSLTGGQGMRERFRLREITVVADRGMVSQAMLEAFEKSDPPVRYIVGVRMRRQKEVNASVLGSRARWFEIVPERSNAKDPAPLKVEEVWVKEGRYIACLNEEERRKDAHDREAIVEHLKEQLRRRDKSLVGNKGYRRYLKLEGSGHFVIDEKQVKAEERYDGIWVLRTNTVYTAETVAHVYKALWTVEDIFRTTKSILEGGNTA